MTDRKSWRIAYQQVRLEMNPAKQLELCKIARRLMQERLLELPATASPSGEQKSLEESLRELWLMEEKIRKPDIH